MNSQQNIKRVFTTSPLIPVMVINNLDNALPMAEALQAGGISVFEITLRSDVAIDGLRLIVERFPDSLVGAGTVLNPEQYDAVVEVGAQFAISPGGSETLLKHAAGKPVPFIPGVATASEIMTAMSYGYTALKFFPAEANGGVKALKALTAPFSNVTICPTGGINERNVSDYLALPCVPCAGGSWMLPEQYIQDNDWQGITELTKKALGGIK